MKGLVGGFPLGPVMVVLEDSWNDLTGLRSGDSGKLPPVGQAAAAAAAAAVLHAVNPATRAAAAKLPALLMGEGRLPPVELLLSLL